MIARTLARSSVISAALLFFACGSLDMKDGLDRTQNAGGVDTADHGGYEGPDGFEAPPESMAPDGTDNADERRLDTISGAYYQDALTAMENGEIAEAFTLLIRAGKRNPKNRKIQRALDGLESSLESEAYYSEEVIRRGKGLDSPLQFLLVRRSAGVTYPVPGMPVVFRFLQGSGTLTTEALTNDVGIAKCYVEEINDYQDSVTVEARVVFETDGVEIELDSLTQTYTFSGFSPLDAPHCLILPYDERSPVFTGVARSVCEKLLGRFRDGGFPQVSCDSGADASLFQRAFEMEKPALRVLANENGAEVLVLLKGNTTFLSQPSTDFYFSESRVEMKIVDATSFQVYFVTEKSERGAGPTRRQSEEQAVLNAMNSLTVELDQYMERVRRRYGL